MNRLLSLIILLLLPVSILAASNCFLVSDNAGKIMQEEGNCATRYTPASTFKIPLALMGFDSGIFKNPTEPVWEYKPEYKAWIKIQQQDLNPRTWMEVSAVWYSQVLTQKLGMEKFKTYVNMFDYGNKDLSGGLTQAWLSSSLKISPQEQIMFVKNLLDRKWPLSENSYRYTREILDNGLMYEHWKLYGKTGTGTSGVTPLGWFVGWIEKDNKTYIFAYLSTDEDREERLKNAKTKLIKFLNNNTQEIIH